MQRVLSDNGKGDKTCTTLHTEEQLFASSLKTLIQFDYFLMWMHINQFR